jgi:hypothetical protein
LCLIFDAFLEGQIEIHILIFIGNLLKISESKTRRVLKMPLFTFGEFTNNSPKLIPATMKMIHLFPRFTKTPFYIKKEFCL